ncbi:MAG: toprim domain-containing protein [candidate division WOR-3 bacterium]
MTVTDLLKRMGCSKIKERGFETIASCPFAPWTHKSGRDRHPSFGVNMLLNDGKGVYHCFACGKSGTVRSMILDYCNISGAPKSLFEEFLKELEVEYSVDIGLIKRNKYSEEFRIPEDEVEEYNRLLQQKRYHTIFYENNIFAPTVERWGAAVGDDKIIFPVKNRLDKILFFVYRWLNNSMPKYTVSKGAKTKSSVYGMNMINVISENPIIVVEGILDCMYIEQMGFNSIAIFGVFIDDKQIDIIRSISPSDSISIVFDDDEAGKKGLEYVKNKLSKYFYIVNGINVPSVRTLDSETLTKIIGGGSHVRKYF